jgi:hypothetical protein
MSAAAKFHLSCHAERVLRWPRSLSSRLKSITDLNHNRTFRRQWMQFLGIDPCRRCSSCRSPAVQKSVGSTQHSTRLTIKVWPLTRTKKRHRKYVHNSAVAPLRRTGAVLPGGRSARHAKQLTVASRLQDKARHFSSFAEPRKIVKVRQTGARAAAPVAVGPSSWTS